MSPVISGRVSSNKTPWACLILLSITLTVLYGCGREPVNGADTSNGSSKDPLNQSATMSPDGVVSTPFPDDDAQSVQTSSNPGTNSDAAGFSDGDGTDDSGITAQEAMNLVWKKAVGNFGDAVLWRIIPAFDKDASTMELSDDWQETGRSKAWHIWYADSGGENWMMFQLRDHQLVNTDIGTRSFSPMDMPAEWPRELLPVSLEEALKAAVANGAVPADIQWLEYTVDANANGFNNTPYWVFSVSTQLESGGSLQYRMFVNALTGHADGAQNLRGDEMGLPIDPELLAKPRETNHQADLEMFLGFLGDPDKTWAVRQLSHRLSPNEAMTQMWLASFESLKTVSVLSIEPVRLEEWTDAWEAYRVVLSIETDEAPEAYGWENGENTRWITLIPQGAGGWKVDEISSSP